MQAAILALAEKVSYCKLSMWYSFSASTEASAPVVLSLTRAPIGYSSLSVYLSLSSAYLMI